MSRMEVSTLCCTLAAMAVFSMMVFNSSTSTAAYSTRPLSFPNAIQTDLQVHRYVPLRARYTGKTPLQVLPKELSLIAGSEEVASTSKVTQWTAYTLAGCMASIATAIALITKLRVRCTRAQYAEFMPTTYSALAVGEDPCKDMKKVVIEYPDTRTFIAIGLNDPSYAASMAGLASQALGLPIDVENLITRLSSNGKYLSVHIGPVTVLNEQQVLDVYTALRQDSRTRYCI